MSPFLLEDDSSDGFSEFNVPKSVPNYMFQDACLYPMNKYAYPEVKTLSYQDKNYAEDPFMLKNRNSPFPIEDIFEEKYFDGEQLPELFPNLDFSIFMDLHQNLDVDNEVHIDNDAAADNLEAIANHGVTDNDVSIQKCERVSNIIKQEADAVNIVEGFLEEVDDLVDDAILPLALEYANYIDPLIVDKLLAEGLLDSESSLSDSNVGSNEASTSSSTHRVLDYIKFDHCYATANISHTPIVSVKEELLSDEDCSSGIENVSNRDKENNATFSKTHIKREEFTTDDDSSDSDYLPSISTRKRKIQDIDIITRNRQAVVIPRNAVQAISFEGSSLKRGRPQSVQNLDWEQDKPKKKRGRKPKLNDKSKLVKKPSNSYTKNMSPSQRTKHNIQEKERRDYQKALYAELSNLLPQKLIGNRQKATRQTILKTALVHISDLEGKERRWVRRKEAELSRLEKNKALLKKLKKHSRKQ